MHIFIFKRYNDLTIQIKDKKNKIVNESNNLEMKNIEYFKEIIKDDFYKKNGIYIIIILKLSK